MNHWYYFRQETFFSTTFAILRAKMYESPKSPTSATEYHVGIRWKTLLHIYIYIYIVCWSDQNWIMVLSSAVQLASCTFKSLTQYKTRPCTSTVVLSPVLSLYVEANEMPLDNRRRHRASQYCLKVSSDVTNPAFSCIFNRTFSKLFDKQPNQIRPIAM